MCIVASHIRFKNPVNMEVSSYLIAQLKLKFSNKYKDTILSRKEIYGLLLSGVYLCIFHIRRFSVSLL